MTTDGSPVSVHIDFGEVTLLLMFIAHHHCVACLCGTNVLGMRRGQKSAPNSIGTRPEAAALATSGDERLTLNLS
jgi:hypothetical protein